MIAILKLMTLILGFKVDPVSGCQEPGFLRFYIYRYIAHGQWKFRETES